LNLFLVVSSSWPNAPYGAETETFTNLNEFDTPRVSEVDLWDRDGSAAVGIVAFVVSILA
jgi:hypothetical protein